VSADSIITRQHNRTDLFNMFLKIVISISRHCDELPHTALNFFAFNLMFATHYCTHIYWKVQLNRFYNGLYLVFCAGGLCRFAVALEAAIDGDEEVSI
jgi:hypothetical protein